MPVADESSASRTPRIAPPCAAVTVAYRLSHPDPDAPGHWAWFAHQLGAGAVRHYMRPLETVLEVAREQGCSCVVVEERYLDLDYRSEYSLFWSRRVESHASVAKR